MDPNEIEEFLRCEVNDEANNTEIEANELADTESSHFQRNSLSAFVNKIPDSLRIVYIVHCTSHAK